MLVRSLLHGRGFRYRLHSKDLPGKPDVVMPKYNAIVLVHGCFWHRHTCHLFKWPSSNVQFWKLKINRNAKRDKKIQSDLVSLGWRIATVWECAIKGRNRISDRALEKSLEKWIKGTRKSLEIRGRTKRYSIR